MIVAHSLGCHIMSSFIWDVRKLRHLSSTARSDPYYAGNQLEFSRLDGATPLGRMETLAGIVTFGNNMPIFAFAYPGNDMFTINRAHDTLPPGFPGEKVHGKTLEAARWINIYSPRDPLGYPLRPLSTNYRDDPRVEDHRFNVEGPFSPPFWGMIDAHVKYWDSSFVVKKTAALLRDLIESR